MPWDEWWSLTYCTRGMARRVLRSVPGCLAKQWRETFRLLFRPEKPTLCSLDKREQRICLNPQWAGNCQRVTQKHLVLYHHLFTCINKNHFYQCYLAMEKKRCTWTLKQRGTQRCRVCVYWEKLICSQLAKKSIESRSIRSENTSSCYGLSRSLKISFGGCVTSQCPVSICILVRSTHSLFFIAITHCKPEVSESRKGKPSSHQQWECHHSSPKQGRCWCTGVCHAKWCDRNITWPLAELPVLDPRALCGSQKNSIFCKTRLRRVRECCLVSHMGRTPHHWRSNTVETRTSALVAGFCGTVEASDPKRSCQG